MVNQSLQDLSQYLLPETPRKLDSQQEFTASLPKVKSEDSLFGDDKQSDKWDEYNIRVRFLS